MLSKLYEIFDDNITAVEYSLYELHKYGVVSDRGYKKLGDLLLEIREVLKRVKLEPLLAYNLAKVVSLVEATINVYLYFGTRFGDVFVENMFRILRDEKQWIKLGEWRGK